MYEGGGRYDKLFEEYYIILFVFVVVQEEGEGGGGGGRGRGRRHDKTFQRIL